jgi:phage recombination protein Bet
MAEKKNEVAVQDATLTEYKVNGESVKLSIPTIKKYLVSGNGQVTDQEAMMFLSLCRYQKLNPFVRDAYCIKYGNTDPATLVIGKDVYTKRAEQNPKYNGMEHGVIVMTKDGEVKERVGSFYVKGVEKLVGGWAKVYIKGREVPQYDTVAFEEYAGYKKDGSLNSNWSKRPGTMIEKVAIMHALRNAFPNDFQGLYIQEEMDNGDLKVDIQAQAKADVEQNANQQSLDDETVIEVDATTGAVVEGAQQTMFEG